MFFNYFSFGYIPTGNRKRDFYGKWTGVRNLLKRMQAKELFRILSPGEGEEILDFGGSSGFFAYEAARRGAGVTAVDVIPLPKNRRNVKKGYLEFKRIKAGENLPFQDNRFDKVLISEVMIVLPNPQQVLTELHRVLKPGGRIVLLNTLGRKQIENAYKKGHPLLRYYRRKYHNCPQTYQDFCRFFLDTDYKDKKLRWYTRQELENFVENAGFERVSVLYPFKNLNFTLFSWKQFSNLCKKETIAVEFNLYGYLFFELLKLATFKKDPSNIVITGSKNV